MKVPIRVPFAKVYRGFRELDRFSDDECRRFVLQAQTQSEWAVKRLPWVIGAAAGLVWMAAIYPALSRWGLSRVIAQYSWTNAWKWEVRGFVFTLGATVSACVGFLAARDVTLIRVIRRRVDTARCTVCRFSLMGLPVVGSGEGEWARCPECGTVLVLAEMGLRAEDLIARRGGQDGAPPVGEAVELGAKARRFVSNTEGAPGAEPPAPP